MALVSGTEDAKRVGDVADRSSARVEGLPGSFTQVRALSSVLGVVDELAVE